MAQVRWSIRARLDIRAIRDFYLRTSPDRARTVLTTIVRAVAPLADFPSVGRLMPEAEMGGLREVLADGYRVLYRISTEGDVEVAAIYHARQDLRRILRNNPWEPN
jgi:plasmid stabilization system protein ParE